MEKLGLNEIRDLFRDFFVSKGHYAGGSSSLIPQNDKSLLIINSGMAPLKPYFSGVETPPCRRMTTCQKCIRTGDIDNVGKTARHGTFFEMLGNFSFGDYFKRESLNWGWEFITEWLHMPTDKLWATIYENDDEAYEIWREIGMPEERIVRLGKDDNFWEIGLGPCGPCSEIYFDRGEKFGCGSPDCKPGCDCDRYIEFWNHVFTQFSREEDGSYSNLAHPNIDTGMGLERLACIMQDVDSIFDVDTVRHILTAVTEMAGVEYEKGDEKTDISVRIVTDHLRSMVFMIADGILPSNEGRGYVLRRLIRRASRNGMLIGIEQDGFLAELADKVIEVSGGAYPELVEKQEMIKKIISVEEMQFAKTLSKGLNILSEYMEELDRQGLTELSGEQAFKLYDTYGFPIEMTEEILVENSKTADLEGFRHCMQIQKETSQAGQRDTEDEAWKEDSDYLHLPPTEFLGYTDYEADAQILYVGQYDKERRFVITDRTPFYATSGGQLHDDGTVSAGEICAEIEDVVKENGIHLHVLPAGCEAAFKPGDRVHLAIDRAKRNRTARGHSATHLMQQALRDVLGDHVMQAGSYVDEHYLRFDFNHFQAVTAEELAQVEQIVNEKIDAFLPIRMEEMPIAEARKLGAMALFGEKYGEIVRVVTMGDYSVEFCGGTHLDNTGKIGAFKILSEYGIASGVRRIEAVTGTAVGTILTDKEQLIRETAAVLKSKADADMIRRAKQFLEENKELEKTIQSLKAEEMAGALDGILASAKQVGEVKLIAQRFDGVSVDELRDLSDSVKAAAGSIAMVFAGVNDGKVTLIVSLSDDLVGRGYHAGRIIKEVAKAAGGGGGGKANMAQAGAKDASRLDEAFAKAEELFAAK
ncbi:MAG: alanine--tRNA ligase [Mogibacterium sp.]|nr:alanine--tRNA ligase [Mogibacterium sp.]